LNFFLFKSAELERELERQKNGCFDS